jgi:hypothetical protein
MPASITLIAQIATNIFDTNIFGSVPPEATSSPRPK